MIFLAFIFSFVTAGLVGIVLGIGLDQIRYYTSTDEEFVIQIFNLKKSRENYKKRHKEENEQ